jgi:hypothetical protein
MRAKHLLLSSALLGAALTNAAAAAGDPPWRVARLAYLHGPVSYSPAGVDDWAQASLNRPVVTGDRIWTEPGARDELQLGNAAIRMDGATLLNVLNLDDQAMQVQLTQGTLNIRVRPARFGGTIEVDTPNLALTIQRPGHYRVSVDPSGQTTLVRVADGQAQVYGPANAYLVGPNQAYRFAGTELRDMQFADANRRDAFDRWSAERDRRAERAVAARYVSPALVGYEDLDDYGSWRTVEGYGPVWTPRRVARDWAPYRDGHWAWVAPWGWTWVDDAPWGFAVSHYGRWANFGGSWGWVPGPASAQPVYAPALVVFVGALASPRRDAGPSVAWFPLAPREVYRPPYQASQRYVTNINVTNTVVNQTQFANPRGAGDAYANRRIIGATTAVPANVFTRAQPVRGAAMALAPDALAHATLASTAPVQAQRESLASHYAGGHRPAQAALSRRVMVHTAPAGVPQAAMPAPVDLARHAPMAAPVPAPGPGHARDARMAPQPMPAPLPAQAPGHARYARIAAQPMPLPIPVPREANRRDPRAAPQPMPVPQVAGALPEHGAGMGNARHGVPVAPTSAAPMPGAPAPGDRRAIAAHGGSPVAMPGANPHADWRAANGVHVAPVPPQGLPPQVSQQPDRGPHGRHNEQAPIAQAPALQGIPQGAPQFAGHGRHQRPAPSPAAQMPMPPQPAPQPAPRAEAPHPQPVQHNEPPRPQPTPMAPPRAPEQRHEQRQEHQHPPAAAVTQQQAPVPHPEPHREPPHPQPAPQPQAAPPQPQPAPAPHDKGEEHHGNGHKDKDGKGK